MTELSAIDAYQLVSNYPHVQLIDVREPFEYEREHIPGSISIPKDQIRRRLAEIDPHRPSIIVCRSGNRSARVADYLYAHGYDKVYNLANGIIGWRQSNLPLERS